MEKALASRGNWPKSRLRKTAPGIGENGRELDRRSAPTFPPGSGNLWENVDRVHWVFSSPINKAEKNLEITGASNVSTGFHNPYGYGSFLLFLILFKPVVKQKQKKKR